MKAKLLSAGILSAAAISALAGVVTARGGGATVETARGKVEVVPVKENVYRVRHYPKGREARFLPSQSVIDTATDSEAKTLVKPAEVVITQPGAMAVIDRESGKVRFLDAGGVVLLEEAGGVDNSASDRKRVSLLTPAGNIYGAGERGHSLRLNGDTLSMYNRQNYGYGKDDPRISQMGISVPYFVTDNGLGVLIDDYAKANLILGHDTVTYLSETPYDLSYYVLLPQAGTPALEKASETYTALTGRQPLPPLWSLGYITSKYGYKTRSEAEEVVNRLKEGGYPLDGMVLDLYWYGVEQDMGRLEWNPEQWPDHAGMLKDLKEKGINMVLISQPYINKGGAIDNYNLLSEAGMLVKDSAGKTHDVTTWVGEAGMFDVSNPETRGWLWNRLKGLTAEGVAGWWGDLGEPEVHPATMVHANGQSAEQYHNAYGNYWSQLIYRGLRRDFPKMRPLLMMRGGTAGLQRYAVFPWTTDVSRSWGGFQPQVTLMLSSGLSGLGYMGSDVGGFAVDPAHPVDSELYARWIAMGAFSPMLRTHAQEKPEPYNYPDVEDIAKKYIKMRYQWLPYNYTLAYENASKGLPLARPLNYYGETAGVDLSNEQTEYLWGRDVLVAPVMEKGKRKRMVTFPAGEWYSWNNPSVRYQGGTTATVKAPLNELPLFVRGGAVIPQFMKEAANTGDYKGDALTLKYFPGKEVSKSVVFDDDHMSPTSLEDKAYQLLTIEAVPEAKGTLFLMTATGRYEGMPASRQITFEVVDCVKSPSAIEINGNELPEGKAGEAGTWRYDAKSKVLAVVFDWDMRDLELKVL